MAPKPDDQMPAWMLLGLEALGLTTETSPDPLLGLPPEQVQQMISQWIDAQTDKIPAMLMVSRLSAKVMRLRAREIKARTP